MILRGAALLAVAAAGAGCGGERGAVPPPSEPEVGPAPPADTMVLAAPGGFEVWLTDVRAARDSLGQPCQERSVEIRRDTVRLRVPLFYTRTPPTLLDRRHLRGELSRDCRTMAVYRIELATGRPYKVEDR